jgi:hypothetical protein
MQQLSFNITEQLNLLTDSDLAEMRTAIDIIAECNRVLGNSKKNVVSELLRFSEKFVEWKHVPEKDVLDKNSYAQYYYHAHPKGWNNNTLHDDEHGHFHTFIRKKGIPNQIKPVFVPEKKDDKNKNDDVCHIIGIALNSYGKPVKLFTVNRWVTGESWYKGEDVLKLLDHFEIDHAEPSWPVNLWITNLVRAFKPQIKALIIERDKIIEEWRSRQPDKLVYEDRNLELTSWLPIDLDQQLTALNKFKPQS